MPDKKINIGEVAIQLSEVVFLINQVTDFGVALDMILDTCIEYFKIPHVGIARFKEEEENFVIVRSRNFDPLLEKILRFNLLTPINNFIVRKERPSVFRNIGNKIKIGEELHSLEKELKTIYIFPFRFHEKINGFLIVHIYESEPDPSMAILRVLGNFVNLIAPIFHVFGPLKKHQRRFENIISKIIKDRIHEARLGVFPVSFAIFRLQLWHEMLSPVALQDIVQTYQKIFDEKLGRLGDIIWLTLDTAFFIFPNADLFTIESLCNSLKEELEKNFSQQSDGVQINLKYVSISYPQTGKEGYEVINQLWIRLFDELRSEVVMNH
ncbi:MAG TPA: hypothetical protein ENL21_08490 [Caldithrix abyssi]|uniref:GGDEF domain-containing protein n=1 Tax=Caldithrix abyssi TaxID=187145 RepID=A0A7V5H5E5_CALAY|nr:hypothetical protein [Caldithrix abyssi]